MHDTTMRLIQVSQEQELKRRDSHSRQLLVGITEYDLLPLVLSAD